MGILPLRKKPQGTGRAASGDTSIQTKVSQGIGRAASGILLDMDVLTWKSVRLADP